MLKSFINSFYPTLSWDQNAKEKKKGDVILLIITLGVLALASFIFLYADMIDMVSNSNLLLKSIFEGKFMEYYTYTLELCYLVSYGVAKPLVAQLLAGQRATIQENGAMLVSMVLYGAVCNSKLYRAEVLCS